eukprot:1783591-Prymnesium_polylepis.1
MLVRILLSSTRRRRHARPAPRSEHEEEEEERTRCCTTSGWSPRPTCRSIRTDWLAYSGHPGSNW